MDKPITPGEIQLEEYLKPMGISQHAMARAIGVAPRAINEIVHGRRSIAQSMSIRFGAFSISQTSSGMGPRWNATSENSPGTNLGSLKGSNLLRH